ncbi:MAG: peptidoglycan bridge formation glycyltransferase FemA/FemB family protein, partial [Spirochaetales bacterium]|nr:peptidoglycan bridge formation glycyltransferase FemA/FemB family protein [Spirochaetales bacterium]
MRLSLSRNDIASSGVFLQSNFWARFKALAGWSYIRFDVSFINGEAPSFALSVLERELGAGIRFAYVPHGPDCDIDHELMTDLLSSLALELRPLLSPRCAFIRFDPAWYGTGQDRPVFDAPLVR